MSRTWKACQWFAWINDKLTRHLLMTALQPSNIIIQEFLSINMQHIQVFTVIVWPTDTRDLNYISLHFSHIPLDFMRETSQASSLSEQNELCTNLIWTQLRQIRVKFHTSLLGLDWLSNETKALTLQSQSHPLHLGNQTLTSHSLLICSVRPAVDLTVCEWPGVGKPYCRGQYPST